MAYDKVAGIDDQHNFPPEVRQKIADSAELKATYLPLAVLGTDGNYHLTAGS